MCGPNLKSAVERNNLSNKDWYLIMCVLCITKSAHFNSIVKGKNKLDKSQGIGSKRLFSFHPELTPKNTQSQTLQYCKKVLKIDLEFDCNIKVMES